MKRLAIILGCLISGQLLFAQGTLTFLNSPAGTGTPGGAPVSGPSGRLQGPNQWAQLYASTTQNGTYTGIGVPVNFRTGAAAGFVAPSTVEVPGAAPGSSVWIQLRAWEGGVGSTLEQALVSGAIVGWSSAIQVGPLGGLDPAGGPPFTAPFLTGLQPFGALPIPEPATWMLCLAGLTLVAVGRTHRRSEG